MKHLTIKFLILFFVSVIILFAFSLYAVYNGTDNPTSITAISVAKIIIPIAGAANVKICSGTLISKSLILTASHCFNDFIVGKEIHGFYNTNQKQVIYRYADLQNVSVTFNSISFVPIRQQVILIPDFQPPTAIEVAGNPDIALLRLESPITSPSPLILSNTMMTVQSNVDVYGYGLKNSNLASRGIRRSGRTNVVDCDDDLCAKGGQIPCIGDSGGPLIRYSNAQQKSVLQGVVSFGTTEQCNGAATVHLVDVEMYYNWLTRMIDRL